MNMLKSGNSTATPTSWVGYVIKRLDNTSECPSTQSDSLDTAPLNELAVVTKAPWPLTFPLRPRGRAALERYTSRKERSGLAVFES